MSHLPPDYEERVYAGVLGKIIGVYLGRPFEGWTHERILAELGEVNYYVHERRGVPLVVTDDDISGTFTFLRALPDNGCDPDIAPAQIGWTWRNYLIENRTVLWWGGLGMSTEHTAFLRLKAGIEAPDSGSIAVNGQVVAEQIGAQIFIDGWGMICPGDPERAADFARRAARVSHDGAAVHGAQVIAALEALAFVEPDLNALLDAATRLIPADSIIAALIHDLRDWRTDTPDWKAAYRRIAAKYGYDVRDVARSGHRRFGGNCHIVPNHALVLLGLLWGEDDFQRSLMITNTAGWDTDCNSGNVGCLMGIKNGLMGIDSGPDWRGPVADRMFLPTADGGRAVTDALRETYHIVGITRALSGGSFSLAGGGQSWLPPQALTGAPETTAVLVPSPKGSARFHFSLPGSVQGFRCEDSAESRGVVTVENVEGHSRLGRRALALRYRGVAPGRAGRAGTATFLPPDTLGMGGYALICSPNLYPGQTVRARLSADAANARPATVHLYLRFYGKNDAPEIWRGPIHEIAPGAEAAPEWEIPDTNARPIFEIGVEIGGSSGSGTLYVDALTWDGAPRVTLGRPEGGGDLWRRAWVNAADHFEPWGTGNGMIYRIVQDTGTGLVLQGENSWADYTVATSITPHMADAIGLVANVRGLFRHVALVLAKDNTARLIERRDADENVIAEAPIAWELDRVYRLTLTTRRTGELTATVDEDTILQGRIPPSRASGAIGLLVREGHGQFGAVTIEPA